MAGSCSKANQNQSSKRKNRKGPKYGISVTRMHTIPLHCKVCGKTRLLPSQEAYKPGGNVCCYTTVGTHSFHNNFSFQTDNKSFGPVRVKSTK